ncbi:preprotein translocase subunit SecG [Sulfuriflexus mobilis]|uniref:preprotein translocase subunit SecG n=1 Tax=Sulfuriflexus mobilis TaxID=1811807 RepID=UPI000F81F088|nr:preprotein translocase subunit SecG [Sulfuriflexus mobilis]
MFTVILVIHVFIAIGLVGLVLIQHGKGADAGAAFGSGSSATVFGSQGSASFLTRLTAVLATGFFISSMSLAYFTREAVREGQEANISIPAEKTAAPVVPDITEIPAIPLDTDIPAVPGAKLDKAGSPDPTQIPE